MSYQEEASATAGAGRDESPAAYPDPEDAGPFETPPSTCTEDEGDVDFPVPVAE